MTDLIMNEIKKILNHMSVYHIETSTKEAWEKRANMLVKALNIPVNSADYHKIIDAHLAAGKKEIETITTLFNTIDSVLKKYIETNMEEEVSVDINNGKTMH